MDQDTLPLPEPGGRLPRRTDEHGHRCDVHAATDIGHVRERNEDGYLVAEMRRWMLLEQTSLNADESARLLDASQGKLLVVADGMGGHAAGDLASAVVIETVADYMMYVLPWVQRIDAAADEGLVDELRRALKRCQEALERVVERKGLAGGMPGTTLTLSYVLWPNMYVVHAGDSRCYLSRGGQLTQLTTDHTVAQELYTRQAIDADELRTSPLRHALFNAVGGGREDVVPELHHVRLEDGDAVLLCTDGLTGHVSDERIAEVLGSSATSAAACQKLVREAKDAGGSDNITVVIARY